MQLSFSKYHGTGNDFILADNRKGGINLTREDVAYLCHRRFGIGADGLMLLEEAAGYDFRMVYYNSDGNESSMCGNGGRCIVAFAHSLGLIADKASFVAVDGPHEATLNKNGTVSLHMKDVTGIADHGDHVVLDTGSPHYILWEEAVAEADVFGRGRSIRNDPEFAPGGINVNFVQRTGEGLYIRTYERGVEDETFSCGTGVTAAAIAAAGTQTGTFDTAIETPGGELRVSFIKDLPSAARKVVLHGPAVFVFSGIAETVPASGI